MNFNTILLLFIVFTAIILIALYFILKKFLAPKEDSQSLLLIQNQINDITRTIDFKMGETTKAVQDHSDRSIKMIREITGELTKVSEGQKQVVDVADQLKNLQDILKNPKQRGVVGEYYLKTVLENVFASTPKVFQMQYKFKNGDIVDAVIFVKDKIIPIDSKFSLENYNRLMEAKEELERKRLEDAIRQDLKNRIDETSKYIKPSEGTMEFAFMFIPSEALYYDLLINKVGAITGRDLVEYAMVDKKVIIVSPTSFLAYLQTVLQGLKALQIEESAKEIGKRVEELGRHLSSYDNYFKKIGNHLSTTVNSYNGAYKELGKINKDVLRITGEDVGIEPLSIDKPKQDDDDYQ
ncbi:DNA recombination protein RmuC [Candidatus Wolfebacteria bacterium CG10_big_fil_rev_8_21_14_0_10_31_9]|uniref:DNA recombination protein RmuC n=1 Tax=Candidatus Wolfebacteria bacterium CG10_big_fil_rev_8_21_14_0_10_31_9 TaxID=1975070 RepID=A0A2H0RDR9_9BACT|nr:MAG: DNA recombination protein RmuC [Candidatus Wolfebacteria bacterium CG10_big_fil_rev_8_21_14_0_10_31_9]